MNPRPALLAATLALLALACRGAPSVQDSTPGSPFEPIPDVELTTQDGRRVHFYDDLVRGRVVVVQFFFVHCQGVCPRSTATMLAMQAELGARLGDDISFLSITLDPEQDTPAVLAEHARTLGAHPGWTFLTGAEADIERLRRRLGVFDIDPVVDADKNQHAGVLVLGNEPKQRWTMKPATLSASFLTAALLRLAEPARP